MNQNTRIKLTDTMESALVKVSDGNPGALNVLVEILQKNEKIDPDDIFGPFGPILSLDALGIYGSRIWMLYKDVCHENINTLLGLIRSVQMGILRESILQGAINDEASGDCLNILNTLKELKKQLPNFQIEA